MSDKRANEEATKRPVPWRLFRQTLSRAPYAHPLRLIRWAYHYVDWAFYRISSQVEILGFFRLVRAFEAVAIVAAIATFLLEVGKRREDRHNQAWALIAAAVGAENVGNIGLASALQTLNKDRVSLANIQLPRAWLARVDIPDADLREAKLNNANLTEAKLNKTKLRNANLSGADLRGANLSEALLDQADLSEALLHKANLTQANLYEVNLTNAALNEANLFEAILSGAKLTAANLSETNLRGADLSRFEWSKLIHNRFYRSRFDGLVTSGLRPNTQLDKANLSGADLRGTNLSETILDGAYLSGADLRGAKLISYLSQADLSKTNLSGADLSGAYLFGANLFQADFSRADLSWADLSGAQNITQEQIDSACASEGYAPTLPDGLTQPPLCPQIRPPTKKVGPSGTRIVGPKFTYNSPRLILIPAPH